MEIIAHRGYWKEKEEKNSLESFRRAKACNFGTETDFRDYGRKLKISHDMPGEESLNAEEFFSLYQDTDIGNQYQSRWTAELNQGFCGKISDQTLFLF